MHIYFRIATLKLNIASNCMAYDELFHQLAYSNHC